MSCSNASWTFVYTELAVSLCHASLQSIIIAGLIESSSYQTSRCITMGLSAKSFFKRDNSGAKGSFLKFECVKPHRASHNLRSLFFFLHAWGDRCRTKSRAYWDLLSRTSYQTQMTLPCIEFRNSCYAWQPAAIVMCARQWLTDSQLRQELVG